MYVVCMVDAGLIVTIPCSVDEQSGEVADCAPLPAPGLHPCHYYPSHHPRHITCPQMHPRLVLQLHFGLPTLYRSPHPVNLFPAPSPNYLADVYPLVTPDIVAEPSREVSEMARGIAIGRPPEESKEGKDKRVCEARESTQSLANHNRNQW